MLLRRIIKEYNLYEGLDITHEINQSLTILNRWWNLGGKIEFEKEGFIIKMIVRDLIDKIELDNILKWINNLGYFPAHIILPRESLKYSYEVAINNCSSGNFAIYFDPKFDLEISDDKLPEYAYHITSTVYEEKISRKGLFPKNKSKLSKHPDRIYLATSLESVKSLLANKSFVNETKKFTIFEINLKELNKTRKIKWLLDPLYAKSGILITYLLLGFIWSLYVFLVMMDDIRGWLDVITGFVCNVLFWPLIVTLYISSRKWDEK